MITLDGMEVFKGEIARACGGIEGGTEAFGDVSNFSDILIVLIQCQMFIFLLSRPILYYYLLFY